MPRQSTTPSEENYIEWIYRFSLEGAVRPGMLADKLGVKRPSVTRAVASLVKKGLLRHEPYGELELTRAGMELGREVVRRDECLTRLLVELLNMPPEEADPEVHRLEHVLGHEVLVRLETLVDFATSSQAWVRRLHHRIEQTRPTERGSGYAAGNTPIHSGRTHEKDEREEGNGSSPDSSDSASPRNQKP